MVVLADTWCEQEAERFVQLAKQQGRAVLLGRPTMGTLDYTNPVMVEYDEFIFTYPISRTAASLEGEGAACSRTSLCPGRRRNAPLTCWLKKRWPCKKRAE